MLGLTYLFPGGLAVDAQRNPIVCDQGNGKAGRINSYAPPYNASTRNWSFGFEGDVAGCALTDDDLSIWGAQVEGIPPPGSQAQQYGISSNLGTLLDSTSTSGTKEGYGVAVSPASKD